MADIDSGVIRVRPEKSALALVTVFTLSIFLSAALLFSVQPMFAKLALPLLGGASNVWNTAMVFFQGTLLAGYIYAHLLSKYCPLRVQVLAHALVTSVGLFFIPLTIASGWEPPAGGAHAFWLIGLFAVSVGIPFFAISANSPLLQRWFSRTDDKDADDPYFLYAASNAGSLLSLCLYPILFEPLMRLQGQTALWAGGYVLMIGFILIAGAFAYIHLQDDARTNIVAAQTKQRLTFGQRATWVGLAFIPSSLLLGVTTHMTTNIASAPFLWILPLALFLLTFIIVFAKTPLVSTSQLSKLFPWVPLIALLIGAGGHMNVLMSIGLSLLCYFLIALFCHSRLASDRPEAQNLTEFYIWMSFGGVLGGIFNALIAPQIFTGTYEYFIVLFLATFVALVRGETNKDKFRQLGKMCIVAGSAIIIFIVLENVSDGMLFRIAIPALIFFAGLRWIRPQRRFLYADAGFIFAIMFFLPAGLKNVVMQDRSFFGAISVVKHDTEFGDIHSFLHGDTVHNQQFREPALRKVPLAYYAEGNTFHEALTAVRSRKPDLNVAMIGLGAGAMACYEQLGDDWTYFEIDPAVVDMARNPDYFTYMQDCSIDNDIRIGDARLTLKALPVASQDFIIVDAFSSDSIPTHLVTREALALYSSRLKDDGIIFFHTSNRLMDVASVVSRIATDAGLAARAIALRDFKGHPYETYVRDSSGLIVGKAADIEAIAGNNEQWMEIIPSPRVKVWSDDYSSIIGPIWSQFAGESLREKPRE